MADKAGSALSRFLGKLGVKSPWKITGVASSPEFASYLPAATEYRKHAPSSPPVRASVPHAQPGRVYDIRYWVRDTRRAGQVVGGTNKLRVEVAAVDPASADPAVDAGPCVPGKPYTWSPRSPLLDAPNQGYTV